LSFPFIHVQVEFYIQILSGYKNLDIKTNYRCGAEICNWTILFPLLIQRCAALLRVREKKKKPDFVSCVVREKNIQILWVDLQHTTSCPALAMVHD